MAIVVQIEVWTGGHRQDLPCSDTLDNGPGRLGMVLFHRLIQGKLDDVLNALVDRQDHVAAAFAGGILATFAIEFVSVGVDLATQVPGVPLEIAVAAQFDARAPHPFVVHEAEQVTQEVALGVVAQVHVAKEDSLEARRIEGFRQPIRLFLMDRRLDPLVAPLGTVEHGGHFIGRNIEMLGKDVDNPEQIGRCGDHLGVGAHILEHQIDGQDVGLAGGVIDVSARGLDLAFEGARLLYARTYARIRTDMQQSQANAQPCGGRQKDRDAQGESEAL